MTERAGDDAADTHVGGRDERLAGAARFCGYCGSVVDGRDRFCAACSGPVDDPAAAEPGDADVLQGPTSLPPLARAGRRGRRRAAALLTAAVLAAAASILVLDVTNGSPPSRSRSTVTASRPAGLLRALASAVGSSVPVGELRFSYSSDPNDSTWVSWRVTGAPGYRTSVQAAGGYAHLTGSHWAVWGPGTDAVGCSPEGSQGAVPSTVRAAFGQSCGSPGGSSVEYLTYTNARFGFTSLYPTALVAQPIAQDGGGASWASSDKTVLFAVGGYDNAASISPQQDEANDAMAVTVTSHSISGDVVTVSGYENGGRTVVYERDVVGPGSVDTFYWSYPSSEQSTWTPVVGHTAQSFRPGDVAASH